MSMLVEPQELVLQEQESMLQKPQVLNLCLEPLFQSYEEYQLVMQSCLLVQVLLVLFLLTRLHRPEGKR